MSEHPESDARRELLSAIYARDPEAVTRWSAIYVALLQGNQVAVWDTETGEREL